MEGRKRRPALPAWFGLEQYAAAAEMDAVDWLLNLKFRAWLADEHDEEGESLIRSRSPVLRRREATTREALGELEHSHPPVLGEHVPLAFIDALLSEPPRLGSGVRPLTVQELYFFERMLPQPVRDLGADRSRWRRRSTDPPAYFERFDHAFEHQMLGRLVRIDLSLPDDVLLADLQSFLRAERADVAKYGGPYLHSLRLAGKRHAPNLGTLAGLQLLPFLDLKRTFEAAGQSVTNYAMAVHFLGLDPKTFKRTLEYAELATDEHALNAWLTPLARGVEPRSKRPRGR